MPCTGEISHNPEYRDIAVFSSLSLSVLLVILCVCVGFVCTQEDLETANGVSAGKYTIGLGQEAMSFTG